MGILLNLTKEYFKDDIRKEDGIKVKLWGNDYIMKFEDISFLENLIPLNEKGDFLIEKKFDFFDEPVYICISTSITYYGKKHFNCHYLTKESLEDVENKIIVEGMFERNWVNADYNFSKDDFLVLRILHETLGDLNNTGIIKFENHFYIHDYTYNFMFEVDNRKGYKIFKNREAAISKAKDQYYEDLNEKYSEWMNEDVVKSYIDSIGFEWIDFSYVRKEFYEKVRESDYDYLEDVDGDYGNQLNDFLLEKGLIKDTADFFDVDYKKPKFKIEDYREKLIDKIMWIEDISKDEATEKVDGYNEEEFIEELCNNYIVQEDEEYFELDYSTADPSKITNAINNLIYDKIEESDTVVDAYLERFGGIPSGAYDLENLAKESFDEDNLGQYLSNYNQEEYNCDIDGNEYFVYIEYHL